MNICLQSVYWDALFVDEKLAIKKVLNNAVFKFVPIMKRRTRQKQIWWTRGPTGLKIVAKIWNIFEDTKNSNTYYNYRMALGRATKATQSA